GLVIRRARARLRGHRPGRRSDADLVAVRLVFFFQAEDGIRDFHVTGVQTCALPIFLVDLLHHPVLVLELVDGVLKLLIQHHAIRSEERRVGKECRSRGGTFQNREKRRTLDRYSAYDDRSDWRDTLATRMN